VVPGNTSHSDNLCFLGKGNCRKYKYLMIWICVGLYQESRTGCTLRSLCIKGDLIYSYWVVFDSDCRHEIKRCLLLGRKVMTNLDSIFKSRDITLPTKVHLVKAMVFPVVMYGCESEWTPGVGDGQGGLECCHSWGRKELDTTEWLNWTELNWTEWTPRTYLL